jgi:arylsulfatase A-like enzyme
MDPQLDYQPPPAFVPPDARGYDGPMDGTERSVHALLRQPGGPRPSDVAQMRALYRGEVSYLDAQLQRLFRNLRDLGIWTDRTLVVFVADHGEQLAIGLSTATCTWRTSTCRTAARPEPPACRRRARGRGADGPRPARRGRDPCGGGAQWRRSCTDLDPVAAITKPARVRVTDRRFSLVARTTDAAL